MALNSGNVLAPASGGVFVAPAGTPVPTDTTTALNAAFVEVGYISEEGLEEIPTRATQPIKAFQNNDTVAEPTTESRQQFAFTMIESNVVSMETYYGQEATTGASEGSIGINPAMTGGRKAWVFTIWDGSGKKERTVVEEGEVVEKDNVVYRNGVAIGYRVTLTAYGVAGGDPATKYSTQLATPA